MDATPLAQQIALNLEAAFAELGFTQPSVAQLQQRSGVSLKTLYRYYPSKQAMVYAALEQRHQRYLQRLAQGAPAPGPEAVQHAFDQLTHWLRHQAPNGCLSASALSAFVDDAPLRQQVADHKRALQTQLGQLAGNAELAMPLLLLHEGISAAWPVLGEAVFHHVPAQIHALFRSTTA
ncbi:TetR/AcrR family transcriptional regulator [Ferrimonas pelagia]|uniref:Helix-turn-helix domain-containing protein n=1 Tax=Ferrimonas pelagia TaxID=1177826 RepID=A0ABP9F221_9GAMM